MIVFLHDVGYSGLAKIRCLHEGLERKPLRFDLSPCGLSVFYELGKDFLFQRDASGEKFVAGHLAYHERSQERSHYIMGKENDFLVV